MLIGFPATRLRTVYLALATFAFAEAAQWVFNAWDKVTNGPDGLRIAAPNVLGYTVGTDGSAFPVMAVLLAVMIAATMYLTTSKFGRAMCAVRDEHVAAASGIDVHAVKVWSFAISAVGNGVAGGMYTLFQSVNPEGIRLRANRAAALDDRGGRTRHDPRRAHRRRAAWPSARGSARHDALLIWQELAYGLILMPVMFMPRGIWGVHQARRGRR